MIARTGRVAPDLQILRAGHRFQGNLGRRGVVDLLAFTGRSGGNGCVISRVGRFLVFECCVQEALHVIMRSGTGESRQRYQHLTFKLGCNLSSLQCARNALAGMLATAVLFWWPGVPSYSRHCVRRCSTGRIVVHTSEITMKVKLKVVQGKRAGKEIAVPMGRFLVGRSEKCNLRLKSDSISRAHCQLSVKEDRVKVKDLGSRNGTYVNDEKITSTLLKDGDDLRIGKMEFSVIVETAVAVGSADSAVSVGGSDEVSVESLAASEHDDISAWLEAEELSDSGDTQQFQMDLTKKTDLEDEEDITKELEETRQSKEPGKLPALPANESDSSRDAAADMLKKFFNRR